MNLVWVLHVLLQERSVARAAAKLHVTPPAVSNALARLRSQMGDPLLVRSGKSLVPTPRALELTPRIGEAMEHLHRALYGDAPFSPEDTTRTFSLACSDADQICSVPLVAEAFSRTMPKARLRIASIDQLEASDGLARGEIDVAIAPEHALGPGVHAESLFTEGAAIVVRRDHPEVGRRLSKAAFNALRHVDVWLVLGRAGIGNRAAEAYFEQHGLRRNIALVVPSFSAAIAVVATTDLAAGVPKRLAIWYQAMLPLRIVEIPAPPVEFQMKLVWHERTHADASNRFFRELVLSTLRSARSAKRVGRSTRTPRGMSRAG